MVSVESDREWVGLLAGAVVDAEASRSDAVVAGLRVLSLCDKVDTVICFPAEEALCAPELRITF